MHIFLRKEDECHHIMDFTLQSHIFIKFSRQVDSKWDNRITCMVLPYKAIRILDMAYGKNLKDDRTTPGDNRFAYRPVASSQALSLAGPVQNIKNCLRQTLLIYGSYPLPIKHQGLL